MIRLNALTVTGNKAEQNTIYNKITSMESV